MGDDLVQIEVDLESLYCNGGHRMDFRQGYAPGYSVQCDGCAAISLEKQNHFYHCDDC